VDANHALSLHGRGVTKQRSGQTSSGSADIATARSINSEVSDLFARLGVQ
jgi:hypothetical protein